MISNRLLLIGLYLVFVLFFGAVFLLKDSDAMDRCQLHHSFDSCHDVLN